METATRTKLIKLIIEAVGGTAEYWASKIADYLIENGVIILPCNKGDELCFNGEKHTIDHWNIMLTTFNQDDRVRVFNIDEVENALKDGENKGGDFNGVENESK